VLARELLAAYTCSIINVRALELPIVGWARLIRHNAVICPNQAMAISLAVTPSTEEFHSSNVVSASLRRGLYNDLGMVKMTRSQLRV
jgi:hypothetical protein